MKRVKIAVRYNHRQKMITTSNETWRIISYIIIFFCRLQVYSKHCKQKKNGELATTVKRLFGQFYYDESSTMTLHSLVHDIKRKTIMASPAIRTKKKKEMSTINISRTRLTALRTGS